MSEMIQTGQRLEWGIVSFALDGESESGDLYIVRDFPGGALVAVVDGLGHGVEAAEAARRAVATLSMHPNESIIPLVKRCHNELLQTRGVVISLVSFNFAEETITWTGVGNVEALLYHGDSMARPAFEHILQQGGVVGYQLPHVRATVLPIMPGDILVLATDGIKKDFSDGLKLKNSAQMIAEEIGKKFRKETDDALVLVVRYRG